jgi:GT2 family glycosyltransferase
MREAPVAGPELTVTVVSYNTRALLAACLESLAQGAQRVGVEVHVVDNASRDGSVDMVRKRFPGVRLFANAANVGFARANNQSWACARGRYWLLLNSDAEVRPGALDELVRFMDEHPRAGLATARLVNADGTPQHCAQQTPSVLSALVEATRLHLLLPRGVRGRLLLGPYWNYQKPIRVGWTWGTALVARRRAVEQCGPLSDAFFMYGEDLEWCLRLRRRGWEVWFCPDAEVLHHGGQSPLEGAQAGGRLQVILDGVYRAVAAHRGWWYTRVLQGANLLALSSAWLGARCKGRSGAAFKGSWLYHYGQLTQLASQILA